MWVSNSDMQELAFQIDQIQKDVVKVKEQNIKHHYELLRAIQCANPSEQLEKLGGLAKMLKGHGLTHNPQCYYLGECVVDYNFEQYFKNISLATGKELETLYTKKQITDLVAKALKEAAIKESNDLIERVTQAIEAGLK